MSSEIAFALAGLLIPIALGAVALVINMRIEIAVLKEKQGYQTEQIRKLLKLLPDE